MKTKIWSVLYRHYQSQEEVVEVLHTLKLQLQLIRKARQQQQHLHLNGDGSVVCVKRLGMIKEIALTNLPLNLGISLHATPCTLFLLFVSVYVLVYLYTTCLLL